MSMEFGDQLKDLNMTTDEVRRFTDAFKDEHFREMLCDYAKEMSDPEKKKLYEEEIKLLEQERGNTVEFIHPEPFKVIKTSVDGKQKCFINVCSNDKVGKPECRSGVSEDGRRGQAWSLPHSLHPGRPDCDGKGNKAMVYDVVFHPDSLHIASKNKRFMNMVDSTAIEGIQKAFQVTLDRNNIKVMRMKYKGTPRPCVVRKPIPGYKAKEPAEGLDHLSFPYPDEKGRKDRSDLEPKSFLTQPEKTTEPTKPNYTVKYRSFIDLQDFRCSRDSGQSPRPKEIVVTIELPLLKSVACTNLEVTEKMLLLESKKPAYRLELPLAYGVDEDKGLAQFDKQRRQLTVTLPVRPSPSAPVCLAGLAITGDKMEEPEEEERIENEREIEKMNHGLNVEEETWDVDLKIKDHDEKPTETMMTWEQVMGKSLENEEEEEEEEEEECAAKKENTLITMMQEEILPGKSQSSQAVTGEDKKRSTDNKHDGEVSTPPPGGSTVAANTSTQRDRTVTGPEPSEQLIVASAGDTQGNQELKVSSYSTTTPPELELDSKDAAQQDNEVGTDVPPPNPSPSAEVLHNVTRTPILNRDEEHEVSAGEQRDSEDPHEERVNNSEEVIVTSVNKEGRDEDDLPPEQVFRTSKHDNEAGAAALRELDQDGNETVISDHSTSAGFTFRNKLMYELD